MEKVKGQLVAATTASVEAGKAREAAVKEVMMQLLTV